MATIKSHTDIPQSKKLAKFLPLESADMWYQHTGISIKDGSEKPIYFPMVIRDCETDYDVPCWSLAALLSVLPKNDIELIKEGGMYRIIIKDSYITCLFDNPVDACYEVIIKLYELKVL